MTRQISISLGMAAVILVVALGLKWAHHQGMVDAEAVTRWTMILIGLMLAVNANFIPKQPAARPLSERALAIRRVAGWSSVLGGLGFAAAWAFVPLAHATELSMAAVGAGMVWLVAFCIANRRAKAYAA
jgi:hypothetical protein